MITRLRALREKYKISLAELERTADVCDTLPLPAA